MLFTKVFYVFFGIFFVLTFPAYAIGDSNIVSKLQDLAWVAVPALIGITYFLYSEKKRKNKE